jgi:hypothetical protein
VPLDVLLTLAGDHVPVMPLVDVSGRIGASDPLQIGGIGVKVGTMLLLTVTVIVVVVAHWPAPGVNVYVPLVVLLTVAGDHVPVIPFVDVVGKTGGTDPLQIAGIAAKVGTMLLLTVTVIVVVVAHWPAPGVNVYVPLVVLLTVAGDHVPVIPFVDVVGKTGGTEPLQTAGIAENVGTILLLTVTVIVVVVAHWPAPGVKVYVPLVVLLTVAGDHVPVIPFVDVSGKTGGTEPLQIAGITVKVGIMLLLTVTVIVVVVAHWPAPGVKVYVPLVVLLTVAGDHVPVIPFVDVVGKTGASEPLQIGETGLKVGTVPAAVTVTVSVAGVAH